MILIRINKNIEIELNNPTIECYDEFAQKSSLQTFLGIKGMKLLRKQVLVKLANKEYTIW
jgi:hypothetical protein